MLKASRDLPVRAMELCLQCLAVLIHKGWRENITPSLSSQLVVFLSLTCDTSGKTVAVSQVTDDLRIAAFNCMSKLFESISSSTTGKLTLVATANVPSLGHAVSVILDGIYAGESFEVQNAAVEALSALLGCMEDIQVLSSFFPGIVSLLTKVLTPSSQGRRQWRILVQCLSILDKLLLALLGNNVVASLPKAGHESEIGEKTKRLLDDSWTKATAIQLKVALANIERLRSHDRSEVRESLANLNLTILTDCNETLDNCCYMALETLLMLLEYGSVSSYTDKARLEVLVDSKPAIAEVLASVFHDELLSLTRVMQSNDDDAKERTLRQVFSAYHMLVAGSHSDVGLLSRMIGRGLRDSVTAILQSGTDGSTKSSQGSSLILSEMPQLESSERTVSFSAPLAKHKSQARILSCIEMQIKAIRETQQYPIGLSSEMVPNIRMCEGDVQVASFWLVLRDLQAGTSTGNILDDFLLLESTSIVNGDFSVREQLYSFSLDILAEAESDWRLKTLALETIAMQANQHKEDFRGELMDVLYPILHHLGSEVTQVRAHATTCLNIVSDVCGYSDVKELIVSNVDYLVNAVALKLNAFDVSPQGPQVLLMMVRLAGPSLLPYLEDTLESIFAALEDYHGYPGLVSLLFAVLKTIAEEGVKSPQLQITLESESGHQGPVSSWAPTAVQDLATIIKGLATNSTEADGTSLPDVVPLKPWEELEPHSLGARSREAEVEEDEEKEEDDAASPAQPLPPAPMTYALLLKITTLTQHYLSSSSPALRISLLSLIRTTIPALAKHENSYLPFINTLWPEITSRIFDSESHVVAASLQIVDTMCEYAGDFMRSRISALWPELVIMYRRIAREINRQQTRNQSRSTEMALRQTDVGYVDVSNKTVWQALIDLLTTVVQHVGIDADLFEEALSMLQPIQALDSRVQAVLEEYNADSVWLARYRSQSCALEKTKVEGSGDWNFIELV